MAAQRWRHSDGAAIAHSEETLVHWMHRRGVDAGGVGAFGGGSIRATSMELGNSGGEGVAGGDAGGVDVPQRERGCERGCEGGCERGSRVLTARRTRRRRY